MAPLNQQVIAGLVPGGAGKRLAEIWQRGDESYGNAADATTRLVLERRAEQGRGKLRALIRH